MADADLIAHWRERARDSLALARLAHGAGNHAGALLQSHLGVEKELKAGVPEKTGELAPNLHDLFGLAALLHDTWSVEDVALFDTLSAFAVAARYDDPTWAKRYATGQNARTWLARAEAFLSRHLR